MTAQVVDPGLSFIGLGLAASFFWGASDFLGGLATRKAHVFLVVAVAHSLSLGLLLLIAGLRIPRFRPNATRFWASVPEGSGERLSSSTTRPYRWAMMGLTTAVTGLLTAVVPVVYAFATQGSPKSSQIAGFVLAAAAIGLIAYVPAGKPRPLGLSLAILAGLGFGDFSRGLEGRQLARLGLAAHFFPHRQRSLACAVSLWMLVRPGREATDMAQRGGENRFLWIAGSAGAIEATGSLLYMRAAREGRLDVAAVLASLYPVVTILLAAWFLKGTDDIQSGPGNGIGISRRGACLRVGTAGNHSGFPGRNHKGLGLGLHRLRSASGHAPHAAALLDFTCNFRLGCGSVLLDDRIRRALDRVLESPQTLAEALTKLRKLARSEDQKCDDENDNEVSRCK